MLGLELILHIAFKGRIHKVLNFNRINTFGCFKKRWYPNIFMRICFEIVIFFQWMTILPRLKAA